MSLTVALQTEKITLYPISTVYTIMVVIGDKWLREFFKIDFGDIILESLNSGK